MVQDDKNAVMAKGSSLPLRSLNADKNRGNEEITFELHLERWIQAKQNISDLGNMKKKSRDSEGK